MYHRNHKETSWRKYGEAKKRRATYQEITKLPLGYGLPYFFDELREQREPTAHSRLAQTSRHTLDVEDNIGSSIFFSKKLVTLFPPGTHDHSSCGGGRLIMRRQDFHKKWEFIQTWCGNGAARTMVR